MKCSSNSTQLLNQPTRYELEIRCFVASDLICCGRALSDILKLTSTEHEIEINTRMHYEYVHVLTYKLMLQKELNIRPTE